MSLKIHISCMTLISLVILLDWLGTASANQLSNVRIAEYTNYTRMVFEFMDNTGYSNPIVEREGRITVIFYECSAEIKFTPQQLKEKTKRINSLVLVQQGSNLFANISLSNANCTIKTLYLPAPYRVVLDIYLPRIILGKKAVVVPKLKQMEIPKTIKPVTVKEPPQTTQFERMEISLLMSHILLNIVIAIMLGILCYAFFRERERLSMVGATSIPDTSDKSMFLIDSKIQEEFKKYQCL